MGERPKGPLPADWRPPSHWENLLLDDILDRLAQHSREGTLPRSPRGLFYDLRPHGMGRGLIYTKRPQMWCVRGDHAATGEGKCQVHGGNNRRVNEMEVSFTHVGSTLALARRAGLVDEDDIEDTRAPDPNRPYYSNDTAEDRVESILDSIRNPAIGWDPQNGQPVYLEVLVEAAGLIGRLARIARPYGVPVYSGGGFDGLKGKRAFAERASYRDMPTVVLRITDWDRHGRIMSDSTTKDVLAWARDYYDAEISFDRIALTRDQADEAGLLDDEGKAEADALPVPTMDAILREAIEHYQVPAIRRENRDRAEEETGRVTELVLAALNGGDGE